MRSWRKRTLCAALAALLCLMMAAPAVADSTVFVVPNLLSGLTLPERGELITMTTKSDGETIRISLEDDVDRLVAQWMGYFDQYEEIQVTDRQATADVDHHHYQVGADSQSSANTAYLAEKDNWSFALNRAGKVSYFWVAEAETDYFQSGLPAHGEVYWENVGGPWYVGQVSEQYESGDVAEVTAIYQHNGVLRYYFIIYRTGEHETYEIRYSAGDTPQYGWYLLTDDEGTPLVTGFTGSLKHWINPSDYRVLDSLDLIPFTSHFFMNPPRVAALPEE